MLTKFRAYVKNGDNYLKCDSDRWTFVLYAISFGENVKVHDHMIALTTTKENVVQSTGVKDRNSVEIFEGDIVKTKCGEYGRHIGVVTFKSGKFSAIGVKQYDGYVEELDGAFEIIGNKYEHPHLLEE
ncbi:YopX family protein [Staphylococcus saprophyticus]|nr:YopX family protein [Staphylococcus saprophyticus]MDW4363280.1 YopX family protein [Staphylococcus saprophyticus]